MARRSVLNRSFSTSEKVLMLVLAAGGGMLLLPGGEERGRHDSCQ
ncbi:MAG: hypothetical protein ACLT98_14520 [Eggerthellaceae bacterium]